MSRDHGSRPWVGTMGWDYGSGPWVGTMGLDHGSGPWVKTMGRDYGSGHGLLVGTMGRDHGQGLWVETKQTVRSNKVSVERGSTKLESVFGDQTGMATIAESTNSNRRTDRLGHTHTL